MSYLGKFSSVLLISSFFLQPLAQAETDPLVKLRNIRDGVNENFQTYADVTYDNLINHYFLWRLSDFSKVNEIFGAAIQENSDNRAEIQKKWDDLKIQVGTSGMTAFQQNLPDFARIARYAGYEASRAQQILNNAHALEVIWSNRCSVETLQPFYELYDPASRLKIDSVSVNPAAPEMTIYVSGTANFAGQPTGISAESFNTTQEISAIASTSTAIAIVLRAPRAMGESSDQRTDL